MSKIYSGIASVNRNMRTKTERTMETYGKHRTILGVKIDSTSLTQLLSQIQISIEKNTQFIITTPNPEIVLLASKDAVLMDAINDSDLAIPDGVGISASLEFTKSTQEMSFFFRIATFFAVFLTHIFIKPSSLLKGREVFARLIELASQNKYSILFIGDLRESAQKARDYFKNKYPGLIIDAMSGPMLNNEGFPTSLQESQREEDILHTIKVSCPDIVFVGFGAPRQEKWLMRNKKHVPKVSMVVGGTFDLYTGVRKAVPKWWPPQAEWGWRLLTEPGHYKRVYRAAIEFPLAVLKHMEK